MQSRAQSAIESAANVAIGYGVALASQLAIFPRFGVHLPLHDNLMIGGWFTLISLARSYAVRRLFNKIHSTHGASHGLSSIPANQGDY